MKKLIAPSILSADFSNLAQQIRLVEIGGADIIHCDIMDGHFVPNLTFGPFVVKAVNKTTKLPLDVHLMIKEPDNLLENFAEAGADYITVHVEEVVHLNRTLNRIRELKVKSGVALNPSTPFVLAKEVLDVTDLLLIMSVNPGFSGQSFINSSLKKIEEAANFREKQNYKYLIEVDGGICKENIKQISDAGCDIFVAGSSIFHSENISAAVIELKNLSKVS